MNASSSLTDSLPGVEATYLTASPSGSRPARFESIDIVRGAVMVLMAIDHTRDYFTNLSFEPETLARTYYALFFTRWVTHFCAPMFFFLAGTGAFLYGRKRTPAQLRRFLLTRGLWLVLLEFTVIGTAWTFLVPWGFFGVIWALGISMVILSQIVRLPIRWIASLSVLVIALHDIFDKVLPRQFGAYAWVWMLLHRRGGVLLPGHIQEFVLFAIIPLFAVMAAGYAFGALYRRPREQRRKIIFTLGFALTIAFVLLRATNVYGNPPAHSGGVSQGDFHIQSTVEKSVILFLDVEKYPPSLQFLLMTIGPALIALGALERDKLPRLLHPLVVYGRVPMFFYVLHLYLIHWMAVAVAALTHQPVAWLFHGAFFAQVPPGYGHGLPFIYLIWFIAVAALYLPCRWMMRLKERRSWWWLSYL